LRNREEFRTIQCVAISRKGRHERKIMYLYFDVRLVQLYHLPVVLLCHSPALQENQL
jgi:hypothetical protein